MAIALKTFRGGNVTPQDDAIIYQTVLPGAGIFKGCEVSFARSNVLHISQGYGMIKGRFFEMYETEVPVRLADTGETNLGRLYLHMDLSNTDEPIQILTETAKELSTLAADVNVNYNNTTYDLELAKFKVTSVQISDLTNTFKTITPAGGGGGGAVGLERETKYSVGDTTSCSAAPGWCTLYCTQAGVSDSLEPKGYSQITKVGDKVLDGTAVFEARNTILELTQAQGNIVELGNKHDEDLAALEQKHNEDVAALEKKISDTADEVAKQMSSTGNLVQKIMSIQDYNRLGTYDSNTMYYCYDNADTQEIKAIYLGKHVIYATGVTVTYQIDTNNAITQTAALSNDAVAAAPAVTKAGYTFVGWKSDTTADESVLDKYIINSASAVKLYAVFKKKITIGMDRMDSDLVAGAKETSVEAMLFYNNGKTESEEVVIPESPYTVEKGMSFAGWTINPLSMYASYMPGEKYKFTSDATLLPCYIETERNFDNPFTTYTYFKIEADGLYEFECWGAEGGHAQATIDAVEYAAKGGKGGYVKVYKKLKRNQEIYIYNGFHPNGVSRNYNSGGEGYSYSSSKHIGAAGGGATYVTLDYTMTITNSSSNSQTNNYNARDKIILIAGGGGGAGISASTYENSSNPTSSYVKGAHDGGDAGGLKGENGSSGVLGGQQISSTASPTYNFGFCLSTSGNITYSGGGAGWYAGNYGSYGNSGAGGSSYVGNNPTFTYKGERYKTVNEGGVNEGHGKTHMRFVMPCKVE